MNDEVGFLEDLKATYVETYWSLKLFEGAETFSGEGFCIIS